MVAGLLGIFATVTPFTGVWIETAEVLSSLAPMMLSHPSRVCGLKRYRVLAMRLRVPVTPFTGVWIETQPDSEEHPAKPSHTLHGCVD